MRSPSDYLAQLFALAPPGQAWPRDPDSWFGRLLGGLSDEFARIDRRAVQLLDEADPLTTLELLPDWERVAGLPDPCIPIAGTVKERQIAVASKIAGIGGQSRAFFIALAARAGLEADIEEFAPFTCISGCDDELCDDDWRHVFRVKVIGPLLGGDSDYDNRFLYFTASSGCDEPLVSWGSSDLECLINRAKPAHAIALFAYETQPDAQLWFVFTEN